MKILKLTMAMAGVCLFGVTLLGLLLGLMHPVFGVCLEAFALWGIFYATAHIDI